MRWAGEGFLVVDSKEEVHAAGCDVPLVAEVAGDVEHDRSAVGDVALQRSTVADRVAQRVVPRVAETRAHEDRIERREILRRHVADVGEPSGRDRMPQCLRSLDVVGRLSVERHEDGLGARDARTEHGEQADDISRKKNATHDDELFPLRAPAPRSAGVSPFLFPRSGRDPRGARVNHPLPPSYRNPGAWSSCGCTIAPAVNPGNNAGTDFGVERVGGDALHAAARGSVASAGLRLCEGGGPPGRASSDP